MFWVKLLSRRFSINTSADQDQPEQYPETSLAERLTQNMGVSFGFVRIAFPLRDFLSPRRPAWVLNNIHLVLGSAPAREKETPS